MEYIFVNQLSIRRGDKQWSDCSMLNIVTNEVSINLNVLVTFMKYRIVRVSKKDTKI